MQIMSSTRAITRPISVFRNSSDILHFSVKEVKLKNAISMFALDDINIYTILTAGVVFMFQVYTF